MNRWLLMLVSLPTISFGQVLLTAKENTYLYKKPFAKTLPTQNDIYDTVYSGNKVVATGFTSGMIIAAYRNNIGYISPDYTDLTAAKKARLIEANPDSSLATAKVYQSWQSDSTESSYWAKKIVMQHLDFDVERIKDSLEKTQQAFLDSVRKAETLKSILRNGIGILDYNFSGEDYSVNFTIHFVNTNKKTIQYIWTTVKLYNAKDSPIATKTVKLVGPIPYNESGSATFENIHYTSVMSWGKLINLKVQYTDGTVKTIDEPEISRIIF